MANVRVYYEQERTEEEVRHAIRGYQTDRCIKELAVYDSNNTLSYVNKRIDDGGTEEYIFNANKQEVEEPGLVEIGQAWSSKDEIGNFPKLLEILKKLEKWEYKTVREQDRYPCEHNFGKADDDEDRLINDIRKEKLYAEVNSILNEMPEVIDITLKNPFTLLLTELVAELHAKDKDSKSDEEIQKDALKTLKWKNIPLTGRENYRQLQQRWNESGWRERSDVSANRTILTPDDLHTLDEAKSAFYRHRGYTVVRMKECDWRMAVHNSPHIQQVINSKRLKYANNVEFTEAEVLDDILHDRAFGAIEIDIHVPEHLREYFKEFTPIFKNTDVEFKDIGDYLQRVVEEHVLQDGTWKLCEMDTDSLYICFANGKRFEDNIRPELKGTTKYRELEKEFFVTDTDACPFGKLTPGKFKIEFEGTKMISLNSKTYVVENNENQLYKFSMKGIQKGEDNVDIYFGQEGLRLENDENLLRAKLNMIEQEVKEDKRCEFSDDIQLK
eukprot:gene2749-biopygen2267